uniref:Uncharacterized protein n=2 Tax=Picea TaxID=3328 RepID=A0A117NGT0_PICGL|nr:hypothetical protein ABT39_MTgene5485 [Picea glauca]QHR91549.1 hypothetical protein Q903MT_gene5584 [Picea sitchensis]
MIESELTPASRKAHEMEMKRKSPDREELPTRFSIVLHSPFPYIVK